MVAIQSVVVCLFRLTSVRYYWVIFAAATLADYSPSDEEDLRLSSSPLLVVSCSRYVYVPLQCM